MQDFDFKSIRYKCRPIRKPKTERDITAIGFDTEADVNGNTFLYCLSDGSIYTPDTILEGLFTRQHRDKQYVVYNQKYEQGAIFKLLPVENIEELRAKQETIYQGFKYSIVGYKYLRIVKGIHGVTFWDMYPFYHMSLANAGREFTSLRKLEEDVTQYTEDYISQNWDGITKYCINDAKITVELFNRVLAMCNRLGIKPTKFYSIATIGYKYVRENTDYVTVERFWEESREILEASCNAYSGGKFEVTTRGRGHFYEYDINSAYPNEIANLIDVSRAKVVESKTPPPGTVYGFIKCKLYISDSISHSVAYKRRNVNIFPVGRFTKWVTKEELEYLQTLKCVDITIVKGLWLTVKRKRYPYRKIVKRLFQLKAEAKINKDKEFYAFVKILLNSIYGKMVQLIPKEGHLEASTCWMPIYGAIITANVRLRMAKLQNEYPSIVAVHTDSVVSSEELPLKVSDALGDWSLELYGLGLILGSGIYQIGDKKRFRGFPTRVNLFELLNKSPPKILMSDKRPLSWREVVFHHWDTGVINKFTEIEKEFNINFDTKRDWLDKWVDGTDALTRVIYSFPKIIF